MKKIKCYIRLHGVCKEIQSDTFESITSAKKWVNSCWNRPYTIVKLT